MTASLQAWWRRPPVDETRWVVVDVEASGLDAARDRLLAVAAIGLHVDWRARRLALAVGDSFEVVVRQDAPSARDNILLHGIGVQRQRAGVPGREALQSFMAFAGRSPLVAFHAAFDERLIRRAVGAALGTRLANPWLDIEPLCGVTHPEVRARSLDEWLDHFGIRAQRATKLPPMRSPKANCCCGSGRGWRGSVRAGARCGGSRPGIAGSPAPEVRTANAFRL